MTVISLSTDPQLAPARAILEKINARRLYKFVSLSHPNLEARECFKGGEREEIAARVLEIYDSNRQHEPALSKSEILVELVNIGNSADPIEHIRFYSKDRPNRTLRLRKDQAGQMLPERFYEQQIRIISKRREREVVDALREAFAQWCAECACFPPKVGCGFRGRGISLRMSAALTILAAHLGLGHRSDAQLDARRRAQGLRREKDRWKLGMGVVLVG